MPFPVLGIDSDNGSDFINHHLLRWCVRQQITFTRSRPNHKNDGAHVEQKNWAVARRTAGYWRYDTPHEMAVLNQIWTALSPLTNLFTPQQKLISKTRIGAKVIKKYDNRADPLPALAHTPPMHSTRPTPNCWRSGSRLPTQPNSAAWSPTYRPPSSAWSDTRTSAAAAGKTPSTSPGQIR